MPPEGFDCKQCGHCCLNLGAYQTCATEEDITLWEENGRDDLLDWVIEVAPGVYDIWMNPETGDYVSRCPWLDKEPGQEKQGLSGIEGACRGDRMSGVRVTSDSGIIAFC
jgi:Fe-S-cluster containining protein